MVLKSKQDFKTIPLSWGYMIKFSKSNNLVW